MHHSLFMFFSSFFKKAIIIFAIVAGCITPFFIPCQPSLPKVVNRYFYYWDETFALGGDSTIPYLKKMNAARLYVKMLDIDWNEVNHAYPVAITQGYIEKWKHEQYWDKTYEMDDIIPVIFITNRTMLNIQEDELEGFADKILSKCTVVNYKELQIDCDWAEKSKERYFQFLNIMKKKLGDKKLSATIRLYQYKYRDKAGVPPVDKGMLMLYNMHNVKDYTTSNSIFDSEEVNKYVKGIQKYPIHLDFALPALSWAVLYRNKKFSCIIDDDRPITEDTCSFLVNKNPIYLVKNSYVLGDIYLKAGDEIKIEKITSNMLLQAANIAQYCSNSDTLNVAIFELNDILKHNIPNETVKAAFNCIH